jgi:hypothetical protein
MSVNRSSYFESKAKSIIVCELEWMRNKGGKGEKERLEGSGDGNSTQQQQLWNEE